MIQFTPERRQILLCDYNMAGVDPEMRKVRRVVVVSPRSYNRAGRCVVVPFSATQPRSLEPSHVPFADGVYRALTIATWAICDTVSHVSFTRLDRVKSGQTYLREFLSRDDMARVEQGLGHALGLVLS
ncbi:type II toxin-antitoxin system PemK/MazF family toxin [Devosia sp. A449]